MVEQLRFHQVRSVRPNASGIQDVDAAVRATLQTVDSALGSVPKGAPVAVTCGSRGIDRIAAVVRAAVAVLRERGAKPFVFPAMGSHGGATPEGQRALLAEYGVTEELVGAPVVSSMETVSLGRTPEGVEVFMDRKAFEAGRVLVLNRVKPHTDFDGEIESGLFKIMTVGMGKFDGASSFHRNSLRSGFEKTILAMGRHILGSGKILAGLGLIENDRHQLCEITAVTPENLEITERAMLKRARELHPKLPFKELDLLIVDEIGKNISGAGMDTKVIGRGVHPDRVAFHPVTRIRRIYVRDVTPESEGNAIGMGFADVIHERVARKADYNIIYTNARAALAYAAANMPMHFSNDREALEFLFGNLGSPDPATVRAAWIRNTLSVVTFLASPAAVGELQSNRAFEIDPAQPVEFDAAGDLGTAAPAVAHATV